MSSMAFPHIIFTNIGVGIRDERWLLYRFELFHRITAPSLLQQTVQRFTWVLFVSEDLPLVFKSRLTKLAEKSVNIHIISVQSYAHIQGEVAKIVNSFAPGSKVLTTRIDDDDALHVTAIERIQEACTEDSPDSASPVIIQLASGFEWLPADRICRPVEHASLALGLSLYARVGDRYSSITQLAHHTAYATLSAAYPGGARLASLDIPSGAYLYTKHPISDSYYAGSRARILSDPKTIPIAQLDTAVAFGLRAEEIDTLSSIMADAPYGMPYKYLEKLGKLRKEYADVQKSKAAGTGTLCEETDQIIARIERYSSVATRSRPRRHSKRIRVGIIGSCVSRDLFGGHHGLLADTFEVVSYVARQSIASYVSTPCIDSRIRVPDKKFEDRRAQWDLQKSHWDILCNSRPDVLLVDFIDERIGQIFHQGSIFTASGPVTKAFERAGVPLDIIRPWDERLRSLRTWSARQFFARLFAICQNIIVHRATWATERITNGGHSIEDLRGSEFKTLIVKNNEILSDIFSTLGEIDVPFEIIGGGDNMRAGGNHLWAFSPFHYDAAYYRQLAKELTARV